MRRRNAKGDVLFDGHLVRGIEDRNGDMLVYPTEEITKPDTDVDVDGLRQMATYDALHELFFDWIENGWLWVAPEQIGALTDAPIITQHMTVDDDGNYVPVTKPAYVYAHMRYQVDDPVAELLEPGVVRFERAELAVPPDPKVVEALDTINRHRHALGMQPLEPKAADWTDEDVLAEARQLKERGLINPIAEVKARMLAW
jgi:hypothetical protein